VSKPCFKKIHQNLSIIFWVILWKKITFFMTRIFPMSSESYLLCKSTIWQRLKDMTQTWVNLKLRMLTNMLHKFTKVICIIDNNINSHSLLWHVLCFLGPRQITASSGLGSKNPTDITPMFSSTYCNIIKWDISLRLLLLKFTSPYNPRIIHNLFYYRANIQKLVINHRINH